MDINLFPSELKLLHETDKKYQVSSNQKVNYTFRSPISDKTFSFSLPHSNCEVSCEKPIYFEDFREGRDVNSSLLNTANQAFCGVKNYRSRNYVRLIGREKVRVGCFLEAMIFISNWHEIHGSPQFSFKFPAGNVLKHQNKIYRFPASKCASEESKRELTSYCCW